MSYSFDTKKLIEHWYNNGTDNLNNAKKNSNSEEGNCYYFDAFISYWICFNAIYSGIDGYASKSEKEQIKEFFRRNNRVFHDATFVKTHQAFEYFKNHTIENLKPDMEIKNTADYRVKLSNKDQSVPNLIKVMIDCIYIVRCNLFHGRKMPMDDKDFFVVRYSADFMHDFLKFYIPKQFRDIKI